METIRPESLDEIIRTKARDMYRDEYLKMAMELKALRDRFNKKEDLNVGAMGDLELGLAARWGNSVRSRMEALTPGQSIVIPGVGKSWSITRVS